jgi:hypothetical protein
MRDSDPLSDKSRLLFGAGVVFGVALTMLLTAVVTVSVVGTAAFGADALATIAGGTLFAVLVGATLFVLAFPANRVEVPVEQAVGRVTDRLAEHASDDSGTGAATERL